VGHPRRDWDGMHAWPSCRRERMWRRTLPERLVSESTLETNRGRPHFISQQCCLGWHHRVHCVLTAHSRAAWSINVRPCMCRELTHLSALPPRHVCRCGRDVARLDLYSSDGQLQLRAFRSTHTLPIARSNVYGAKVPSPLQGTLARLR
jgi:hypothetical protein